ncbi:redox-sensitive transcriptional activator SoxR [Lentibacter algarum]|uniref:redox-sensitive transcriptional activator SoxR n=1 Tax=Lentibacter algarum TaxID=576131 RepID=UPI001C07CF8C|nr:redox-sensitive transcriptional activator SoxR [Lentibacter algarum]MBU2980893.1 redox-sensitive transcriptional activator SoxR [Lentibacter algarum]
MLPIGQIAKRTGLAVSALRFYENEGLIKAVRTEAGQRQFKRADIRRVSFIKIAQGFGFTLPEIKQRLQSLPDARTPNARDWRVISEEFRTALDARIAVLTRMRDDLDGCIGCGCLSLEKCRLYNAGDAVASKGTGAQLL